MNRIKFLKLLDWIIGKPLLSLLFPKEKSKKIIPQEIKRILIVRPGGIGDSVLLLPAISVLKTRFPAARIDLLCEKRNSGIYNLSRDINRVYLYDRDFELFKCLKNKYAVAIDAEQWHRLSAIAAYFSGAPVRIGFDTNERRKLFTHRIAYKQDDYEIYSFLHLIQPLLDKAPEFKADEAFIELADEPSAHLASLPPEKKDKIIAIFPGATVKERKWGIDKFGKVAQEFSNQGYKIVIIGSSADKKAAEEIKKYAPDSLNLTGKTSLREVAGIFKASKVLLTTDSGLMHLAYAVGTPAVALFGSGIEKKWAPRGKNHIIINKHLSCSPCTRFGYMPECNRNVECLSSISVDEVIEAVERLVNL